MRSVAVFARRPLVGAVKTRLSPALPPAMACDLHVAMLADALDAMVACAAERRILWWHASPLPSAIPVPAAVEERVQVEGDLGARLAGAFLGMLSEDGDRAVVIGSDAPGLAASDLDRALDALERHDLVLAPARDGGYSLIGLTRPAPALFAGIEWGTSMVLERTLEHAAHAQLRCTLLDPRGDLDTPADLAHWIAGVAFGDAAGGARTRAALAGMGLLPRH